MFATFQAAQNNATNLPHVVDTFKETKKFETS